MHLKIKEILIISPGLMRGGMERQLYEFLKRYDRTRFRVSLALFKNLVEYDLPKDIRLINLNKKGKLDFIFLVKFFLLISKSKWDIINAKISGVNEYVLILSGFLRKKNIIVEIRNTKFGKNNIYKQIGCILSLFQLSDVKIICNSYKAEEEIKDSLNVTPLVICNGIDTEVFRNFDKERSNNQNSNYLIGYVGRIAEHKNIEILILAVKYVIIHYNVNITLGIWGAIQDLAYYSKLSILIRKNDLSKIVNFYDQVNEVEMVYNSLDLFVLPSFHEGTPNVLLEAMSCELPVLVSIEANSDNFLSSNFTFDSKNHIELGRRIYEMYVQPKDQIQRICRTNRLFVKKSYSIDSMVNTYSNLYQSM